MAGWLVGWLLGWLAGWLGARRDESIRYIFLHRVAGRMGFLFYFQCCSQVHHGRESQVASGLGEHWEDAKLGGQLHKAFDSLLKRTNLVFVHFAIGKC